MSQLTQTNQPETTCLFLDIGGVLLTDGWDHDARRRARETFGLETDDMEERHRLNFATYEEGHLTLTEYLDRVVFHEKRSFSHEQFRKFMFDQSRSFPKMIRLFADLKLKYSLKIAVVSNEAREINAYRIRHFKLTELADLFVSSCFIHMRKPDEQMFRLSLDLVQVPIEEIVYVDNTVMFVEIAKAMGIRGIAHANYDSTRKQLAEMGLD